jgi:hypothetical protein
MKNHLINDLYPPGSHVGAAPSQPVSCIQVLVAVPTTLNVLSHMYCATSPVCVPLPVETAPLSGSVRAPQSTKIHKFFTKLDTI